MPNPHSHDNFKLFCLELMDQGLFFEMWRMAREGEFADRDTKDRFLEKYNHLARRYPELPQNTKESSAPLVDSDERTQPSQTEPPRPSQSERTMMSHGPPQRGSTKIVPSSPLPKNSTSKRHRILLCLSESEPLRQVDIANNTGIPITALYNLVDDMKSNGLLTKVGHPEPGRQKPVTYIEISDKGRSELERINQANASNSD